MFSDLEVFVKSYPAYRLEELEKTFAFGKTLFEDEQICIERKAIIRIPKPGFPRVFFWDFDYDRIDWDSNSTMVIQRILERGLQPHWQELVRFYGSDRIIEALREKISFLPDEMIDDASSFFNLQKEEILCYKRKQSQPKLWL